MSIEEFLKIGECPLEFPMERGVVVLIDEECKEWEVQCMWMNNRSVLTRGCRYFSHHYNIKKGDICTFEQVDNKRHKFMYRVHIDAKENLPFKNS